jgi:hypothetical protein
MFERVLPNLEMEPEGFDPHRPALLVVSRIVDVL